MGFFKDLKEDLSLAVSEITGENAKEEPVSELDVFSAAEESMGIEYEEEEGEPVIEEALGSFLDQIAANAQESEKKYDDIPEQMAKPSSEEYAFAAKAAQAKASIASAEEKAYSSFKYDDSKYESSYKEEPVYREESVYKYEPTKPVYEPEPEPIPQPTDELGVITANMSVSGDIVSTGSLDVMGKVIGNIKVMGELNITGGVSGSCEAATIVAANCSVNGDMISSGPIKIGSKAIVKGNIYATSAVISGAIKGDIDVHGPVILDSTAIVMGNIKSKAVQINSGAAVEGMCSQCYADVSPSAFFRD